MLDRLKSLPLTIFLTILIWMYAEAQFTSTQPNVTLNVAKVPIWVSGPPAVLAKFEVEIPAKMVTLTLSGPSARIEAVRAGLADRPQTVGICAYVDLLPEDRAETSGVQIRRRLRYVYPEGLTLVQAPVDAEFRLTEKAGGAASQASGGR